jgi:hypothetical protein
MPFTQLIIIVTWPRHGGLHMTAWAPGVGMLGGAPALTLTPIAFRHPLSTCDATFVLH